MGIDGIGENIPGLGGPAIFFLDLGTGVVDGISQRSNIGVDVGGFCDSHTRRRYVQPTHRPYCFFRESGGLLVQLDLGE